jgi:hypothetical protein
VHDVEVRDSYGRAGTLRAAFTESDRSPPLLSATVSAPARVEIGAPFTSAVTIANSGGTDARISALDVQGVDAGAAGSVIPAGGTFEIAIASVLPLRGPATLQLNATAVDTVTGVALEPLQASAAVTALSPPSLSVSLGSAPSAVDAGQRFTVAVTVINTGDVDALSVAPQLVATSAYSLEPIAAQDVAAGASRTFAATLEAITQGQQAFDIHAAGVDQLSGATVTSVAVRSAAISIVRAAALSGGAPTIPATLSRGESFTVTVVVANSGQADALAVVPSLSVTRSGGADLTVVSAPAAGDVPGGGSQTFAWSCVESGTAPGTLEVTVSASGVDANSGAAVSAFSPSALATVQETAVLSLAVNAPNALSRGQTFQVEAAHAGDIQVVQLRQGTQRLTPEARV